MMIAKRYILNNLKTLKKLYDKTSRTQEVILYSKMAILELCGWIEETMDDIVRKCSKRNLKDSDNIKYVENNIIKRTHGFDYNDNFRKMLMQVLGIITVEELESKLDLSKFQMMKSTLRTLKLNRDNEAHTHIKGVTTKLDAPSVTISRFWHVNEGLTDIDIKLKSLKTKRIIY